MIADADVAFNLSCRLMGACSAILAAETLLERRHYKDEGLMSWPVMQTRNRLFLSSPLARALGVLESYPGLLAVTVVRLIAGVALVAALPGVALWLALSAMAVALFNTRHSFGMDGADQLNLLCFAVLLPASLLPTPLVKAAGLWFLAAELALSYLVAGVAKILGEEWRTGRAAWGVLSTRMYGVPQLGRWLKAHPAVSWLACWGVIAFECGFVLVFVAPEPVAWTLVALGVGFHVVNAVVMGLNTFLWAFLACYPALIWVIGSGARNALPV